MILVSVIIAALLVLEGYLLSRIFQKKIPSLAGINSTFLGILVFFGIFEFIVYPAVCFQIPVIYMLVFFFMLLVCIPIAAMIVKIKWLPSKHDWLGFGFALVICVCMFYLSYHMTLGEQAFDSVYYLSMVLENSSKPILGSMNYYSGITSAVPSAQYDFQGFYYVFSMILKIVRNLPIIDSTLLTPVYIWSASLLYYFTLGLTVFECVTFFVKKQKGLFLALLCLLLPYFCNYYNTGFGFYGNTYKTLAIAGVLFVVYIWIEKKEDSLFIVLFLLISSLISFSSSGFFIACFIMVGFFFSLVFSSDLNYKHYRYYVFSIFPMLLFFLQYVYYGGIISSDKFIFYLIIVGYVLLVIITAAMKKLSKKQIKILLKGFKVLFFLLIIVFLAVSFMLRNTRFSYEYFFEKPSSFDMELDLFSAYSIIDTVRNVVLWTMIVLFCLNRKCYTKYSRFLFLIFVLFLNPLVEPFVANYMTNLVYHRSFEIMTNPFILSFLFYGALSALKNRYLRVSVMIAAAVCSFIVFYNKITVPYTNIFKTSSNYDPEYKISDSEIDLYEKLTEEIAGKSEVYVISQSAALKGYVNNITVRLTVDDFRTAPVYGDHSMDTDDINLYFYPRDYDGQEIWNREPDYSQIAQVAAESGADYFILSKNVTILDDSGVYVPLFFNVRAVADVIYDNDNWVLMKIRDN